MCACARAHGLGGGGVRNCDGYPVACTFCASLLALSLLMSSQSTALPLGYDINF